MESVLVGQRIVDSFRNSMHCSVPFSGFSDLLDFYRDSLMDCDFDYGFTGNDRMLKLSAL